MTKEKLNNENGRSMVEMLGVLAVMGVLSIAGIAAYSFAMNKHRANELMYEASKRATVVAMQAAQGRTAFSISEFDNNEALHFSDTVAYDSANKQFTLEITGVDEAVCQQMQNMKGDKIRKFTPATCADNARVQLTYNDDLSSTVKASDFATQNECQLPFKWCSGASSPHCANDCCAGVILNQCQDSCDSDTGEITPKTDGITCDYTSEGAADGECKSGICVENLAGKNCYSQDDCGGSNSIYYCNINTYTTSGSCNSSNASYYTSVGPGICLTLGDKNSANIIGLGEVVRAETPMNWWSADNWCKAQDKSLIDISKFEIYRSGTSTLVVSGTTNGGCASGKTCGYWGESPYKSMWNGDILVEIAGDSNGLYKDRYSATMIDLRVKFGNMNTWYWTASPHGNNGKNSCNVFTPSVDTGWAHDSKRQYTNDHGRLYLPLCL